MTDHGQLARRFPADFTFGVATAAFQIEGASGEDNRGSSIWDDFARVKGRVKNGDTGEIACDHYHCWQTDLDLIQALGVRAYRFSIAWPRLLPEGRGAINAAGLGFYDRLIDGCLERGLKVFPTLYHWDLPSALMKSGGWTGRDTAYAFADYAHLVAESFGDRINAIATLNEPWCTAILGHLQGVFAPGISDIGSTMQAIHTQHLAHGMAIVAMRSSHPKLSMGIVLNAQSVYPLSAGAADKDAAQRHFQFHNATWFDPLFKGHYPSEVISELGHLLPPRWQDDLAAICQPLDFWGLNYYTPTRVTTNNDTDAAYPATVSRIPDGAITTDIGWEIAPETLTDLLLNLNRRYRLPPCYITENGACYNHQLKDGEVDDFPRKNYLQSHLDSVANAIEKGVDIRGYFAWSLLDNFEWAEGYAMRFGIVHVDYDTQTRTIKRSGHWYRNLVTHHRLS
ncbi:MAG: GH1 family beta-glucosidase [Granulosicoccus sp.]